MSTFDLDRNLMVVLPTRCVCIYIYIYQFVIKPRDWFLDF